jgi:parallel beta-helix repeat protein
MNKRFAIVIGAAALGAAVMAVGASANHRSVHDPRGDTTCRHEVAGPCSDEKKRSADIVRATAGHEGSRLRHTIRVVGKFKRGGLTISTDSDRDCELYVVARRGRGSSREVKECVGNARTGRARIDFHRHSVEIVFSKRSIGNPQSYGWTAATRVGYLVVASDQVPNRGGYIRHRLAQPAAALAVQQLSCGDTITTDTTLHKDLVDCPNNGIVIGADNVTLDLNGHTIDGAASGNVGVLNDGHDGVTVRHGSVRDFGEGVVGSNVAHNRLLGISASRIEAIGIHIYGSPRILVRNCSGNRTASHDTAGILVIGSPHFRILNSSFRHNEHRGISVLDSTNGVIKGNVVSDSGDEGVHMGGGEGVRITHNRVVRTSAGITLEGHGNLVAHNVVAHARHAGIRLGIHSGAHNVVRGNLVRDSHRDGFLVQKKDRHSLLKGNIARRAGDDGFEVKGRTTKLTENRAVRNGDLGIAAVRGVNDGGGNVARHNGDPRQCTHVACN